MTTKICPNCHRTTGECASEGSQECWRARCLAAEARLEANPDCTTQHDERVELDAEPRDRVAHLEQIFGSAVRVTAAILRDRERARVEETPLQARLPLQYKVRQENLALLLQLARRAVDPVPLLMHCPMCHTKHIDEGRFATKLHHTHACQGFVTDESGKRRRCGHVWRPAIVSTTGVEALPGFINEETKPDGA